jgi:hypothetical protein
MMSFIHPGSRIPDPTIAPKEDREKLFLSYHFCGLKYYKIVNNFIFEQVKKFYFTQTPIIIVLFTQIFDIKLSKIWVWDRGSGIRKKLFGIQGQKGTGSRIRNTAFAYVASL